MLSDAFIYQSTEGINDNSTVVLELTGLIVKSKIKCVKSYGCIDWHVSYWREKITDFQWPRRQD